MATLTTLNAASPLDLSDDVYLTFTVDTDLEVLSRALDDVDTDLLNMDTLTFNAEYSLTGANDDDTYSLRIRIVNGTTILAAADSGGTFQTVDSNITSTTDITSGVVSFSYVNTTATKADWNGASVELQQGWLKNKSGDGVAIRVDQVIFDGTYTSGTIKNIYDGANLIEDVYEGTSLLSQVAIGDVIVWRKL